MSDLDDPLVRERYNRLVKFSQECGLSAEQLQKLITLTINGSKAEKTRSQRAATTDIGYPHVRERR